jgi:hypothetical protein
MFAIVQLALHALALASSVVTVGVAYVSVRHDYAREMVGAYAAVSTCSDLSPPRCLDQLNDFQRPVGQLF